MLSPDFKEFVSALDARGVRYLVVGGYAVAFHGHPRYTKDLDIWLDATQDNARAVVAALADFGFASLGLTESDFLELDQIVQLGYPPNRIDLLTSVPGPSFEEAWKGRVRQEIDGVEVNFIGLDHLRQNKRSSGRHQDLADLENLDTPP